MENPDRIRTYEDETIFEFKYIVGWIYVFAGLIGIACNVFIFDATLRKRKIKTPVYAFIVNLALTDIFLAFLLGCEYILHKNHNEVLQYFYICNFLRFFISSTEMSQFFTLTAIIVSLFTEQPQKNKWRKVMMIMCLLTWWYIAANLAFPKAYYSEEIAIDNKFICIIDYTSSIARFTLIVDVLTSTECLLVFLFIGFVVHKVKKGSVYHHSSLNFMMVVMILIQVALVSPIIASQIARLLAVDFRTNLYLTYISHVIFFLRVTYRPVLYVCMNEDYRQKLRKLLFLEVPPPVKAYEVASQQEEI